MSRWKGKRSHCQARSSVGSRSSKGCPETSYENKVREREEVLSHIKQEMGVRGRPDSHDSFSNYLVRKQRIFKNGFSAIVIKRREKMEFTDLDEMAGKMASAKKLERKIEHEDRKCEERKIKLRNIEQLHYFRKDYDSPNKPNFYDYGRETEDRDRERANVELPSFKDSKKSGRSLIKRNRSEVPARGSDQNLNPWK